MKKTIVLTLIVSFLMLTVAGCGSNAANSTDKSSSTTTEETKKEATVIEVPLKIGKVQVYDFGDVKLHAYATNDALNDE